ncbi:hypothetical protein BDR22DRAFT_869354 [Usnea florida]
MPPLPQLRCSRTDGVKGSAERRNKGVDKQRTPRHTVRKSNRATSEQSGPDRPVSAAAITADATNSFKPPSTLLDYVTKRVAEEDVKASTDLIVYEACQADRANLVKELKARLAVVKRDEKRRKQGRSATFTREELQKGEDLWAADRHSLGISLDADRDYPGDSVPDNVSQTEGEDNQDLASSPQQEQFDASSDDLMDVRSEVSGDGLEEDGHNEDGSEGDGSESSYMVDSVDSSESEV